MDPIAHVPYGIYWSTPFCRWQGSLSGLHSLRFAAHVARQAFSDRQIPTDLIDLGILGMTVPQEGSFYGLPWFAGLAGLDYLAGPTVNQACATSARIVELAAREVAAKTARCCLTVAADRTSNGPHLYYPAPAGPGGTGRQENWVLDNFGRDPWTGDSMIKTAETVALKHGITTEQQHQLVLRRYEQYCDALNDQRAFQRRYMRLPFEVPTADFRKAAALLQGDEGIYETNRESLDMLKPVLPGGTVTYGAQTHPADGSAGLLVTDADMAGELSVDRAVGVSLIAFGQARVEAGHMPEAPVPAAKAALDQAGLGIADMTAIKSHNPFIVNDIVFCREFGLEPETINNFGCSLVWGHPQGPTGLRAIIELIEELALIGGGYGLFHGCAAGDSAMAIILRVDDRR